MVVAVCYRTDLGPKISFYETKTKEEAGRYAAEQVSRSDYIAHSWWPLS